MKKNLGSQYLNQMITLSSESLVLGDEVEVEAEVQGDPSVREFEMVAYSGGIVGRGKSQVIVDLKGIRHKDGFPILMNHSAELIVGNALEVDLSASKLQVRGVIYADEEAGAKVLRLSKREKWQWEASMGFLVEKIGLVADGEEREVNGRLVVGPIVVIEESTLRECSFVPLGEDSETEALAFAQETQEERIPIMEDEKMPGATVAELRKAFPDSPEFVLDALERGLSLEEAKAEHDAMMAKQALEEKEAMKEELESAKKEMADKIASLESQLASVRSRGAEPVDVAFSGKTVDLTKPLAPIKGIDERTFVVEWNQSEELRKTFSDFDSYKTLRQAEEAGLVKYK